MTLFEANHIHAGEVDGVFMVGFADHQDDTKNYLLFQLSDDTGVDKIYLERDDQIQSTDGGITGCELYANLSSFKLIRRQPNF
jgi:hypothetical protein